MNETYSWLEQDSNLKMDTLAASGWMEDDPVSTWMKPQSDVSEPDLGVKRKAKPILLRKPKKKKQTKRKKRKATPFFERPVVAIDTEYRESEDETYNRIISYQVAVLFRGKLSTIILYPESTKKSGRLALDKCLVQAIEKAMDEGVLDAWPTDIILCAHWLSADLFNFSQAFDQLKTHVKGLRKTVASLDDVYGLELDKVMSRRIDKEPLQVRTKTRNPKTLYITFYDTMLLSPNGSSLASVGELLKVPKVEIPEPYSISRMDEFLEAEPEMFAEYAITDAIISARHFERVSAFCQHTLGLNSVPFTIGGIAVKAFVNSLEEQQGYRGLFGFEKVTKEVWPSDRTKPLTITRDVPVTARMTLENFATQCYHGGRNESFIAGPSVIDTWRDYDVPSCYSAITLGLRELAYDQMYMTKDLHDLFGDKCALAWVEFKFPENTRFPSLAVRSEYGLIFPLSGETHCTGHELEVAYNQGVEITIKQAFVVPWKNDERIFESFMKWGRERRKSFVKGSFDEKLTKEMLNSCYGKLAQSLRPKNSFDIQAGYSKQLPPSTLTNPFFAAYTTGLARALLGEQLHSIPDDKVVVSVTTDGFLTNAELDEIDLSGSICQRFRELYHRIDPTGGEVLELKHQATQLIGAKTRAQYTVIESEGFEPVLAKGGVKVDPTITDQSAYMVEKYLARKPGDKVDGSYLTPNRMRFLEHKDLMLEKRSIYLNMEFDQKREMLNPVMVDVQGRQHIALETKPHQSLDEMLFTRLRFDRWRKSHVLKDFDDWCSWQDRLVMAESTSHKDVRLKADETSDSLMARLFLRFYAHEKNGMRKKDITAKALAEWLTDLGYPTKATAVRSAKQSKLIEGAVPITELTTNLARLIVSKFPDFEVEILFNPDSRSSLREALSVN
ncbi:putative DNA-directed DNA polymerase [Vibrio coralliirubri]|uniref:DNA polymerase n=1 Tax=Vibrio coralliirubri TaxID=1516159 RepID=UPI000639C266|nr:DNA polymerase [Vibrio coralliirubri]CDT33793.1 putative DNA-directed DNA polymerase [Vibrio coralliirubri]